jgi:hypothetical protein
LLSNAMAAAAVKKIYCLWSCIWQCFFHHKVEAPLSTNKLPVMGDSSLNDTVHWSPNNSSKSVHLVLIFREGQVLWFNNCRGAWVWFTPVLPNMGKTLLPRIKSQNLLSWIHFSNLYLTQLLPFSHFTPLQIGPFGP